MYIPWTEIMLIKHDLVKTALKPERLSVDLVEVDTPRSLSASPSRSWWLCDVYIF